MAEFPLPTEGIVLTHFVVSADVERSLRFYSEVLGARWCCVASHRRSRSPTAS